MSKKLVHFGIGAVTESSGISWDIPARIACGIPGHIDSHAAYYASWKWSDVTCRRCLRHKRRLDRFADGAERAQHPKIEAARVGVAAIRGAQNVSIRQLGWTTVTRRCAIRYSTCAYWRRFSIVETSTGFTVADKETRELARVSTLAAARAWAGIKVGEQDIRHS